MTRTRLDRRDRLAAGLISGALVAVLLWALVVGLAIASGHRVADGLKLFGVAPPPPPPPREKPRPKVHNYRPRGAAAPPNLRAKPTEIVAPKPAIVVPTPPPPVVVAPIAGPGAQASAGAADVAGPGTGAGGAGNGLGGGGDGDGDGAGDTPPRQVGGGLRYSDLPIEIVEAGRGGTVGVRYVVAQTGRVTACQVRRSSGDRQLDELTCRLIVQRFRFRPARDADGAPFEAVVVESHSWDIRDEVRREER